MLEEKNWEELAAVIARRQRKASRIMLAASVVPIILGACLIIAAVTKVSDAEQRVEALEEKAKKLLSENEEAAREHDRLSTENAEMERRNEELAGTKAALEKDIEATREKLAGVENDRDSLLREDSASLKEIRVDFDQAQAAEKRGFDALESGDYPTAIRAFEEANESYPKIHCATEISALLKKNIERLTSNDATVAGEARSSVILTILEKHVVGMPKDVGDRLIGELDRKLPKAAAPSGERKVMKKAAKHLDSYGKT